jgi:VanZ family protein
MSATDPNTPFPSSRLRWVYPLLVAALVVVASGRSQVAAPGIMHIDKVGHGLVFGLIATLIVRIMDRRKGWWAVVIVSLFGISDEFRQSFTPGRSVEFADWVADTVGALLAVTLYLRWGFYRRMLELRLVLPVSRKVPAAQNRAIPAV